MAYFSQDDSPLKLFTPLEAGTLVATRLSGWERLGDSFEFTVDLLAPPDAGIGFDKLLGKTASVSVSLPGKLTRYYHGIIWDFSQGDTDDVAGHYTLMLRPRLALLGLTRQSRIFQGMSAVAILREVLKPVGGGEFHISSSPPIRDTCAQYRETDLEFFLRLCGEEGIIHYWRHDSADHQLVLTDNSPVAPALGEVEYDQTRGGNPSGCRIHAWKMTQSLSTTAVGLLDSHFQLFNQKLEGSANGPNKIMAGKLSLTPTGGPVTPWQEDQLSAARYFDGVNPSGGTESSALSHIYSAQERQSRILALAAASGSVRARLLGNCCHLAPGHAFALAHHPTQSGPWLVVEARHTVSVEGRFWLGEANQLRCEVTAEAAPVSLRQLPWPPRPRPRVGGVQTAVVIGPSGQEMFTDPYGRVQVRFFWDRAEVVQTSCWLRVAQVWAGNSWGACFWPRVGHEVVVSFEDGDPDRPLITGSVYNAANMPPFIMPDNQFLAGWKSLTEGGDPSKNFHHILMSDEKDSEVVLIHAESTFISHQESAQITMRPIQQIHFQG